MSDAEVFNSALTSAGFGVFNVFVLLLSIPGTWAIMFATTSISFIMARAECDLKLTLGDMGILNAMPYIGMLIFTIFWSVLSDNVGRRKIAIITYFLDGGIMLICSMSQTKYELMIFKFLNGGTICGAFAALMTYVSEMHTGLMRTRVLFFIGVMLTLTAMIMPGIAAITVPATWEGNLLGLKYYPWQLFLTISALPSIICAIGFLFMPESPKFDMTHSKGDRALETLKSIFTWNSGKLAEDFPVKVLSTEVAEKQTLKERFQTGWSNFKQLLNKQYILLALNIFMVEFCVLMCQNTFRLWLPKLFAAIKQFKDKGKEASSLCQALEFVELASKPKKGSCSSSITWASYTNNFYVGLTSLICYIVAGVLLEFVGAKIILCVTLGLAALFSLLLAAATNETALVSFLAIYLASENVASTSIFNACLHFFPTHLRNSVLGIGMTLGRIGSFIGNYAFPHIIKFNCIVFFVWIAVLGILAFVLSLFIPNPTKSNVD